MNARSLLVVGLVALTACNDSSSAEPDETAPPPTAAPTEPTSASSTDPSDQSTSSTASAPTEASSTEPTESTTSTPPESTIETTTEPDANADGGYLPADLGTVVDSAPGVDSPGEVTELIDNVWFFVPSEPVETDPSVVPPLPEDQAILVAYAEAQAAYHEQASMNPIPAGASDRLASSLADGGQRLVDNVLAPASANDEYLDLSDGIVLRPVVIADPRSEDEAFIFDCQLDGTVFVNADGTLADGQVPGVREFPQIASVIRVDGEWIVDRLTRDERACA